MRKVWILLIWIFLIDESSQVSRCMNAPTKAKRIVCEQLHRWDAHTRASKPLDISVLWASSNSEIKDDSNTNDFTFNKSNPYQCMDLRCICRHLKGEWQACSNTCLLADGKLLTKSYRKEYRTLCNEEKQRLHEAFRIIKQNGEFDRLAVLYSQHSKSGGAHSGPAFLPWHREFLKRLEIAIRLVDPELSLPYWDSTLDSVLPKAEDSVLWTDELMGSTNENETVKGDFSDWKVPQGRRMLRREVGFEGSLLTKDDIEHVLSRAKVDEILTYTAPQHGCHFETDYNSLEYAQGAVQIFVGGDMFDIANAANDPLFYLHHAFIDSLWEEWRQQKQSRPERENLYPRDLRLCSGESHFSSAFMRPFEPLRNIDGLGTSYTDYLYEYAPRPSCSDGPSCGSKYLFCDHSRMPARCVSKVKPGGNCAGFHRGEPVCYRGRCVQGICVTDSLKFSAPTFLVTVDRIVPKSIVVADRIGTKPEQCFNEHECCSIWAARGECKRNHRYMSVWCKASCKICKPTFNINAECADFHLKCKQWTKRGECKKNPLWMRENCRKSCDRCNISREEACSKRNRSPKRQPKSPVIKKGCASPGCYNEHFCCPIWKLQGQCSSNATYMSCHCRVSCAVCVPHDYVYGTCKNYHSKCKEWALRGECKKTWMMENCRQACRSCFTLSELKAKCDNEKDKSNSKTNSNQQSLNDKIRS